MTLSSRALNCDTLGTDSQFRNSLDRPDEQALSSSYSTRALLRASRASACFLFLTGVLRLRTHGQSAYIYNTQTWAQRSPERVFGRRLLHRGLARHRGRVHRLDEPRLEGAFLHFHAVDLHYVLRPLPFWRSATAVQFQHHAGGALSGLGTETQTGDGFSLFSPTGYGRSGHDKIRFSFVTDESSCRRCSVLPSAYLTVSGL